MVTMTRTGTGKCPKSALLPWQSTISGLALEARRSEGLSGVVQVPRWGRGQPAGVLLLAGRECEGFLLPLCGAICTPPAGFSPDPWNLHLWYMMNTPRMRIRLDMNTNMNMKLYMHTCTYTYIYTHVYVCLHMYKYMHLRMYICVYVYMHVCICVCPCIRICICICICAWLRIYIYTYLYMYMYM